MDFHCRVIFKCVNEIERCMEGFVGAPSRKKRLLFTSLNQLNTPFLFLRYHSCISHLTLSVLAMCYITAGETIRRDIHFQAKDQFKR